MRKNNENQLNLTVVALVALVAIVGLVALVLNTANMASVSTGGMQVYAVDDEGNIVGKGYYSTGPIETFYEDISDASGGSDGGSKKCHCPSDGCAGCSTWAASTACLSSC